jgi:hypothetical protein
VSERDPRDVIRIEELERENTALREELARVRGDLKELTRIVEELQKRARKDKRQAHLFRRESEKKDKKQAGRKLGHDGAFRERPDHVDESVEARLARAHAAGGRFSTSRSCFSTSSTCPKSGCTCCRFSPREAGVVGAASTCAARTLGRCRRREGQQPSQWGPRPRRWWWS